MSRYESLPSGRKSPEIVHFASVVFAAAIGSHRLSPRCIVIFRTAGCWPESGFADTVNL